VSYGNTNLTAGYIEFSMTDNHVCATGITDSTGKTTEKPHFTDGGEELTAAEIEYNFETKKGVIREVRSRQGEGYVHMEVSKKHVNDEIHLEHGKYTRSSALLF